MPLIDELVAQAQALGASDLHIEANQPVTLRVNGILRSIDTVPSGAALSAEVSRILPPDAIADLEHRRSADLSRTIGGARCRLNIFYTSRGVALAVRILQGFQVTVESLNLHPDLLRFLSKPCGLLIITGSTGSGKSSTIAGLVEELNRSRALHVLTLEQPVEHHYRPRRCLIRQREVGRDTPSFHQGLMDALREDPDVIVVGEVRDAETIRLALTAAETGHLVLTSIHSGTCAEALARMIQSFPAEAQAGIGAALAESLVGVVAQRLYYRADLSTRLPECEVLVPTDAVRASIRAGSFARLPTMMQTGGAEGMWTFDRWRRWQEGRERWFVRARDAQREPLPEEEGPRTPGSPAPEVARQVEAPRPARLPPPPAPRPPARGPERPTRARVAEDGVLELDGESEDLAAILRELS